MQYQIYNITLGIATEQISNYYAPFANSNPTSWQPILNVVPTSFVIYCSTLYYFNKQKKKFIFYIIKPSFVNGVCKSVTTGATIQIAYALLGNIDNPQAEIAYVSYNWDETQDVGFRVKKTNFN